MSDATEIIERKEPRVDIFAWANNLMADREDYSLQLFFLNKNGVLYTLNNAAASKDRLRVLFLDGLMERVLDIAETGYTVRPYEATVKNDGNIAWLPLEKVNRAANAIDWLQNHLIDTDRFNQADHDLKRQVGIIAAFSKPDAETFYVFKQFDPKTAPLANKDFVLNGDSVEIMRADAAFRVPDGEQVVIIGGEIFVFNQPKFESLFSMKPHQVAQANKVGAIIDERFALNMPLIVKEVAILAQQSTELTKRLANVDPYLMSPDQVAEAINEFDVGLMIDDDGKIILEDGKDLGRFLDVLTDSYVHGTTNNYLAKIKKPLQSEE